MAAIALRAVCLLVLSSFLLAADQPHDVLQVINSVATALTDKSPSDAMLAFDKSIANYSTLQSYFAGLTGEFDIANEADVLNEQDSAAETQLTLQWSISLTDRSTNENLRRTGEVRVRLMLKDRHWKIVAFAPLDLFNPQVDWAGKS